MKPPERLEASLLPRAVSLREADLFAEMDTEKRSEVLFKWATFEVLKFQQIKRGAYRPTFWALPLILRQESKK